MNLRNLSHGELRPFIEHSECVELAEAAVAELADRLVDDDLDYEMSPEDYQGIYDDAHNDGYNAGKRQGAIVTLEHLIARLDAERWRKNIDPATRDWLRERLLHMVKEHKRAQQ